MSLGRAIGNSDDDDLYGYGDTKETVVVTGFEPFSIHKINSSWEAVKCLSRLGLGSGVNLVVQEIPVEYSEVRKIVPDLWETHRPKLMVHCGVSGIARELTLEQAAFNEGYRSTDNAGLLPCDNCCVANGECKIESGIQMAQICRKINDADCSVKAVVSNDPGRYLCDFIYYSSLHRSRNNTAFVHVPPLNQPYTAEQLGRALRHAILAMLGQLDQNTQRRYITRQTNNSNVSRQGADLSNNHVQSYCPNSAQQLSNSMSFAR